MADGAITSDKLSSNILNYSLNEVDTGAKWVDGKPIYKKTINAGTLPNSTTKSVPHGIVGLDRMIIVEGMAKTSGANPTQISIPHLGATDGVKTYYDQTNAFIETLSNRSDQSGYLTLYYVKS